MLAPRIDRFAPPDQLARLLRRVAFTLMEMLVVVAIIVALAGLGGYYFMGQLAESKISNAQTQSRTLQRAVETYQLDHFGQFPPDLQTLLQKTEEGKGPYLQTAEAIMGPWGQPYVLDISGAENTGHGAAVLIPDIYAVAPDGKKWGNWKETRR